MSNFAHTPFVLDGVEYGSIEGFYVALKFLDPTKRAKVSRRRACEAARDKAPNKTDGNDTDGLSGGFARILPGAKQVC